MDEKTNELIESSFRYDRETVIRDKEQGYDPFADDIEADGECSRCNKEIFGTPFEKLPEMEDFDEVWFCSEKCWLGIK